MRQLFLIWCWYLLSINLANGLTGDNVCKRIETTSESIEYIAKEPVTYRYYTWCLKMPPRCSKYTTVMEEKIKTKLQINNNTIDYCCDGYVQMETYCVPECKQTECPHLKCDSEKKCNCDPGYYGQRCHMRCRLGFWGMNCANKCVCNGEPCNLTSGDCLSTTSSMLTSVHPDYERPLLNTSPIPFVKISESLSIKPPNSNAQAPYQLTTSIPKISQKIKKTESKEKFDDYDIDATVLPDIIEGIDAPLLIEDEVIVVHPNEETKSYDKITIETNVHKTIRTNLTTNNNDVMKQLILENNKKSTSNHDWKINEFKLNTIKYINLDIITEQNKTDAGYDNKININDTNKYYNYTSLLILEDRNFSSENILPQKNNGLPPPVPDGADNTLGLKNKIFKNNTTIKDTKETNNYIIKSNDLQRDMEDTNSINISRINTDSTINSSLVKAKWTSTFSLFNFFTPSLIILIISVFILSASTVIIIIKRLKKKEIELKYYEKDLQLCHQDNLIPYSGHYASPSGHQIFYCPEFTNSYAFNLAQELRETHYDHPRSARCLVNEPLYTELQY